MKAAFAALAILVCPWPAFGQVDFDSPIVGAPLLEFDDGEFSGNLELVLNPIPFGGLETAFPPDGLFLGLEPQARAAISPYGFLVFDVDAEYEDDWRFLRSPRTTAPGEGRFGRSVRNAHWAIFASSPINLADFIYDGRFNWRLIEHEQLNGIRGKLILTWDNIPAEHRPNNPDDRRNAYQMILTHLGSGTRNDPSNGDAHVQLRYARCEWHNQNEDSYFVVAGFHNTVNTSDDIRRPNIVETQPDWYHPDSYLPTIKKLCLFSNIKRGGAERGVWEYEIRDGVITGCGLADAPYVDVGGIPGQDCEDNNNDPGDGCSPECYIESNADNDNLYEPPPNGMRNPDGTFYDPLGVYDQCVSENPAVDCNDLDGDGIIGVRDNCPDAANPFQEDFDADGIGDRCDDDKDGDGIADNFDICVYRRSASRHPEHPQAGMGMGGWTQLDADGDGPEIAGRNTGGDPCDPDDDNDGILDCGDDGICPHFDDGQANIRGRQLTVDAPGEGFEPFDNIDNDRDGRIDEAHELASQPASPEYDGFDNDMDGLIDERSEQDLFAGVVWPGRDDGEDNCRTIPNPDQSNVDGDVFGDACDPDADGDGKPTCGDDGWCAYTRDLRDNDNDGRVDEAEECAEGCDPLTDHVDNDGDGLVDEHGTYSFERAAGSTEDNYLFAAWPGPDANEDNCPLHRNALQTDSDGDGVGDACDDDDGDGFFLAAEAPPTTRWQREGQPADNCPAIANPDQLNSDGDALGDLCDDNDDNDARPDDADNCPTVANDDQADLDGDGLGNACDPDIDDDGLLNDNDGCPFDANPSDLDTDEDGRPDACDEDIDGDRIANNEDNCPAVANRVQFDSDGDGDGDACDADDDNDGVLDEPDNCWNVANPDQLDTDGDLQGDACDDDDDNDGDLDGADNCPLMANSDQANNDGDAQGDVCDDDDDNDGVSDADDGCPRDARFQADTDGDELGDECGDENDDGDAFDDDVDRCPLVASETNDDLDGDLLGDVCDDDDDADGVADEADNCKRVANGNQANLDRDMLGDACDPDIDGDGVLNDADNCERTINPDQTDANRDGLGDACADIDSDGVVDALDNCPQVANLTQSDIDNDGRGDACDGDFDLNKQLIEECRARTAPLEWRRCNPPLKRIGCAAVPGQAPSPWLLLGLLAGWVCRRRSRR